MALPTNLLLHLKLNPLLLREFEAVEHVVCCGADLLVVVPTHHELVQ